MTTAVADPPPPNTAEPVQRPRLAKLLRVLAIPIIIFWVLVAVVTNVFVPSLDDVTADNAGPLVARDAPSAQAAIHQGNDFDESNYTSVAVLLLETEDRKLGEQDHQYYNEVVRRLLDDTKHVASVQDLWGKPVTMSGSQSADAEATTLTIRPVGDLGSSEANESIAAIRDIVAKVPKPDGLYRLYHRTRTAGGRYDTARHGFEPGQADDRDGHPDHHHAAHCLSVDHDRADPAVRGAHHAGGGPRHHLVPRGARDHRDLLVRDPTCWCPWSWVPRRTMRFFTSVDTRKPVKQAKTRNRPTTSPSPTCRTSSLGRVLRSRAPRCA